MMANMEATPWQFGYASLGSQLVLMSLFWKKMKALFLQTKICEVSQIRIN